VKLPVENEYLFEVYDLNLDGYISIEEIEKLGQNNGMKVFGETFIDVYDTNNDDQVEKDEFDSKPRPGTSAHRDVFRLYDKNKDKLVSVEEVKKIIVKHKVKICDKKFLLKYDVNQDGNFNRREFEWFIKHSKDYSKQYRTSATSWWAALRVSSTANKALDPSMKFERSKKDPNADITWTSVVMKWYEETSISGDNLFELIRKEHLTQMAATVAMSTEVYLVSQFGPEKC